MSSTIMRNSQLPDDWLRQACAANPITPIDDRYLSGPVRLAFPSLFEAREQKRDSGETTRLFEATLLFPPIVDLSIPWNGAAAMATTKWPKNVVNGQLVGVGLPFTSQDDKSIKYEGFTPGGWKLTARSKFQPRVIDPATGQDVTDPRRVYPGVWAIVDFNFYPTEIKGNRVNTSINIVYLLTDDTNLGGGGPDPSKGLASIKTMAPIMAPPVAVNAAASYAPPPGAPAYQHAPNVAPPPAAPAYAPPPGAYSAPVQSYAPVVETPEQRMMREAGLL